MCFGSTQTGSQDKTSTANPAVANGATSNLNFVQNLENQGPVAYTGQYVAPFSDQQQSSFGMANNLANSPLVGQAQQDITNYGAAPASSVSANTIASAMNPYMSQYVQQSLAPQLENFNQSVAAQNKGAASNSTMAGAFGNDAQDALYRSNLTNQQNIGLTGLVGNAYNSAFNTAIGAGAQDVSNNLNAQTTNANLNEAAINRQMGAAQGLQGLIGTQSNLANLQNSFGQQQTAASQADLNAQYSDWLRQQQQPYQAAQLMNQTVSAGSQAMPASTQTTNYAPNNSGYALLGAIGGGLLAGPSGATTGAKIGGSFADGGDPPVGIPSMVGERGPELFQPQSGAPPSVIGAGGPSFMTPNQPGTVIPNEQIAGGSMPDVPPTGVLPSQTLNSAVGMPPTGVMPAVGGPSPTGMMGTAPNGPTGMMPPVTTGPTGAMPPAPVSPTGAMGTAPGATPTGMMGTAPQTSPTGAMGTAPQQPASGLLGAVGGLNAQLGGPNPVTPTGTMPTAAPSGMMPPAGNTPSGQMPPAGGVAPTGQMGLAPNGPTAPGIMPTAPNGPTAPGIMPTAQGGPLGGGGPIGSPIAPAGPTAPGVMPTTGGSVLGGGGPIGSPTAPQTAPGVMPTTGGPTTAPGVMPTTGGGVTPTGAMGTAPGSVNTGMLGAFGTGPTGVMPTASGGGPVAPTGAMPTTTGGGVTQQPSNVVPFPSGGSLAGAFGRAA